MNYKKILISSVLPLSVTACSMLPASFAQFNPFNPFQPTQTIGRFQLKDNLVVDTSTNLMWTRCLLGASWNGFSCGGVPLLHDWQQAQSLSKTTTSGGFNDWRVPTLDELKSLAEKEVAAPQAAVPYINQAVFPTPNCHGSDNDLNSNGHICWQWTSSRIDGSDHYAWIVYFGYGYGSANYETDAFSLRLVRNNR